MLVANELHPEDAASLEGRPSGEIPRVKLLALDGWIALKSLLPPKERRGVILIDPPFEEEGELGRVAEGLGQAFAPLPDRGVPRLVPDKGPQAHRPLSRGAAAQHAWPELLRH